MDDKKIIIALQKGNREEPIKILYQEYPKIERLIVRNGLTKEQAREIFNDSLILLIEKVESPNFLLSAKLTTYLYGINRFLAQNELKKQRRKKEIEWNDAFQLPPDDFNYNSEKEDKLKRMEQLLTQISKKCLLIFRLFYFENKSMSEIAEELGYTSTNSAKTQKYKCIERAYHLSNNPPK